MKFIVDAQLPQALANLLMYKGFDTIRTKQLPNANSTEDIDIIEFSIKEERTIITKDSDFLKHYILKGTPSKLLVIATGNIVNKELIQLI